MEKTEEINWREYIIWHDYCSKKYKNDINMRQEERFLNIAVLMGVFFVLLFLGVPIAYSLCLSAVLYICLLYTSIEKGQPNHAFLGGNGDSHHCQLLHPVLVNAQILKGKGKYELLPVKVDNGAYHADGLGEDGCQGRAGYS